MPANPKIKAIQKEIEATKAIMVDNIEKIIIRGEKLEALQDRSQELAEKSAVFLKDARKLKHKLNWQSILLSLVIFGFIIAFGASLVAGHSLLGSILLGGLCSGLLYSAGYLLSPLTETLEDLLPRFPKHKPRNHILAGEHKRKPYLIPKSENLKKHVQHAKENQNATTSNKLKPKR